MFGGGKVVQCGKCGRHCMAKFVADGKGGLRSLPTYCMSCGTLVQVRNRLHPAAPSRVPGSCASLVV